MELKKTSSPSELYKKIGTSFEIQKVLNFCPIFHHSLRTMNSKSKNIQTYHIQAVENNGPR